MARIPSYGQIISGQCGFNQATSHPADPIKRHRARRERSHPKVVLTAQTNAVALDLLENGIRQKQTSLLAFVALTAGSPDREHWAINSRTRPLKKIRVCVGRLIDSRHVGWRITLDPIGHIIPTYKRHQANV
jgi:hypothetical protein